MSICLWVIVLTRDHGQSVDLVEQIIWRVYCQVFFASYHQRTLQQVNIWFCKLEDFLPKWFCELGIMISFGSTFAQDFWILTCSRVMWLAFPTRNYRMLAYLHSYIILFHLRYMVSTPDTDDMCAVFCISPYFEMVCVFLCVMMSYGSWILLHYSESAAVSTNFNHITTSWLTSDSRIPLILTPYIYIPNSCNSSIVWFLLTS